MTAFVRTVTVTVTAVALLAGSTTATLASSALAAPTPTQAARTASAGGSPTSGYRWTMKPTGSDAPFRGLAPVSKRVAWVSGTAGTVLRVSRAGWPPSNAEPLSRVANSVPHESGHSTVWASRVVTC